MPFELKIWCESCNREKSEIFRVKNGFFYKTPKDLLPYLKKNKKKIFKTENQKFARMREGRWGKKKEDEEKNDVLTWMGEHECWGRRKRKKNIKKWNSYETY